MIVAHGGEPLLYPDLDYFFEEISGAVKSCKIVFSIQTNGTLLNTDNLAILERHAVGVGISVDGNREVHNRERITHSGTGSYDSVVQGIQLARTRIPHLFDSVLQVINTSVPPIEMLDTLESYGVGRADLLFPDLNHDTIVKSGIRPGDIGEWLIEAFDEWVCRERTVYIRLFIKLIHLLTGGREGIELLGARSAGALMIETDGSYDIYDGLKTAFQGAGHTGMSVEETAVNIIEALPLARAFRDKASAASVECLQCHLFPICGGGNPIHRYSEVRGFDQPTVYCKDMMILIEHIRVYLKTVRPSLRLAV
jgi:uncharacterized protein